MMRRKWTRLTKRGRWYHQKDRKVICKARNKSKSLLASILDLDENNILETDKLSLRETAWINFTAPMTEGILSTFFSPNTQKFYTFFLHFIIIIMLYLCMYLGRKKVKRHKENLVDVCKYSLEMANFML